MALYYASVVNLGFEDLSFIRHLPFEDPADEKIFYQYMNESCQFYVVMIEQWCGRE